MSNSSTPRSESSVSGADPGSRAISEQDLQDIETAAINITMSHEISYDAQFKLPEHEEQKQSELHQLISKTMERAFWDKLRDDLTQEPPQYAHAIKLLAEIKGILLHLAGVRRNSWHTRIEETLDMELIYQQTETNTFNFFDVAKFIIDAMCALCVPVREDEIKALRNISDLTELFKGIFAMAKLMSRDLANFYIQSYRPIIQQQNIQRERENFAVLVQKLPNPLKNTKAWFRIAMRKLAGIDENCGESSQNKKVQPSHLFREAYASLLDYSYQTVDEIFPETMTPDMHRIFQHKQDFNQLVLVASVLLSSINFFEADLRSNQNFWNEVKDELLQIIKDERLDSDESAKSAVEALLEQIFKKVHEYISRSSASNAEKFLQTKDLLLQQAPKFIPLNSHPVYKLLKSRTLEYVSDVGETIRISTSTVDDVISRVVIPSGMSSFHKELKDFARSYSKVVGINYEVYKPFHGPLLEELYHEENVPV